VYLAALDARIGNLTKDHIINSHHATVDHLKLLFNIINKQGFVPEECGIGLIIKDKQGDICSTDNNHLLNHFFQFNALKSL